MISAMIVESLFYNFQITKVNVSSFNNNNLRISSTIQSLN
jgi:hypothetical protein